MRKEVGSGMSSGQPFSKIAVQSFLERPPTHILGLHKLKNAAVLLPPDGLQEQKSTQTDTLGERESVLM